MMVLADLSKPHFLPDFHWSPDQSLRSSPIPCSYCAMVRISVDEISITQNTAQKPDKPAGLSACGGWCQPVFLYPHLLKIRQLRLSPGWLPKEIFPLGRVRNGAAFFPRRQFFALQSILRPGL